MKRKRLMVIMLLIIALVLASCSSGNDSSQTSDNATNDEAGSIAAEPVGDDGVTVFDFQTCAVDDNNVLYVALSKQGIYRYEDSGSGEAVVSDDVNTLLSLNGDVIYYLTSESEDDRYTYSLKSVKTDGSDKKVLLSSDEIYPEALVLKDNKLYYADGGLYVYDLSDETIRTIDTEIPYEAAYRDGRIIYHHYDDTLYSYDLSTDEIVVLTDKFKNGCSYYFNGDNIYAMTTAESGDECVVYQVLSNHQTKELYTIKTDHELQIAAIDHNTVFYQDYSPDTSEFSTYSLSLADGKVIGYKEIDYRITENWTDVAHSFAANQYRFIYDYENNRFMTMTGIDDVKGELLYHDADFCYFRTSYTDTVIQKVSVTYSETIPKKESLYTDAESSPDNEYVRLKRTEINKYGFIAKIPELTINSEDAKAINAEIEESYSTDFWQYYRYVQSGSYLTLYVATFGTDSYCNYLIYTIDTSTGRRLDNNDIIALITDDAEAFNSKLNEEIRRQQYRIYRSGASDLEIEIEKRMTYENDVEITDEMLDEPLKENWINYLKLGYLGEGKVLCVSGFVHLAGAGGGVHLFEFEY